MMVQWLNLAVWSVIQLVIAWFASSPRCFYICRKKARAEKYVLELCLNCSIDRVWADAGVGIGMSGRFPVN